MHIIFGNVTYWQTFILIALKYLKFKVYYIWTDAESDIKKKKIAEKLKKNNIFPLPIEFQKEISPKASSSSVNSDPNESAYKKNIKLASDSILKKYCNLFSMKEKEIKKLRILLQDFISIHQIYISGPLVIWSTLHPKKKIIYVSFKFKCFYNSATGSNILSIIIPLDIFKYLKKIVKKIFLMLFLMLTNNNKTNEKKIIEKQNKNLDKESTKNVAFIPHKGLIYGSESFNIYEKTLYYSENKDSCLNKYNILHLDYSNYSKPEEKMLWVNLKKIPVSVTKIFFKTLMGGIKTIYLIRSWQTFLAWALFIFQYNEYLKYFEIIKKFKNLKIAIVDYEALCPKVLIMALEKNNIKTVGTQERFIHTFFTSFVNVILDTYYVSSEYAANIIKNSKYHYIKNIIPVGQYRSDYISLYKNKNIPDEIFKAKQNGKKIIVFLGHHSPKHWFDSSHETLINWSAQISFLQDVIKFSEQFNDTFIVLRYKFLDWTTNSHFKNILDKINKCKNIIISSNYKEPFYSYKLCANADLIVAKHTSIADESLSKEMAVLFYEYTHNMKSIISDVFDYSPSEIMCYNFNELLNKSKSLLFDTSSKLKKDIIRLNETIYYVKDKGNIKNKILNNLESLLSSA